MFIIIEIIILILEIIYQFLKLLTKCICRKRKQVSGQVVLITGSAHGIGRELAFLFQERGARLALVDINQVFGIYCRIFSLYQNFFSL